MARINKYRTGKLRSTQQERIDPITFSSVSAELQASQPYIEFTQTLTEGNRTTGIMYTTSADRTTTIRDGEVLKWVNKRIKKNRRK
tara:strand:+ start:1254 stop:1511 length:258 start_codon:yes stop_codon:yes gene_type:complete